MELFKRTRQPNTSPPGDGVSQAGSEGTANLPPPQERGIPPVNPRSYQSRGQVISWASGALVLLALMWAVNRPSAAPAAPANDPHATQDVRFDEGKPTVIVPPLPTSGVFAPARPADPTRAPIAIVPAIDAAAGADPAEAPRTPRELTPLEKRMKSKSVIYDAHPAQPRAAALPLPARPGSGPPSAEGFGGREAWPPGLSAQDLPPAAVLASATEGASTGAKAREDEHSIAGILRPTRLEGVSAVRFPDRTLMLATGKMIDCILDTAIDTGVAGMVKCTLPHDVYSENGKAVLLDRGTELTGEYRNSLRTGQARLGIVWSRARTPAGVLINLDSPATDSLGRGGVDGWVDNHFWERYGAAILLSTLDDALAFALARASSQQVFVPENTTHTGRDAAAVALEANVQIPPTIVVNQGAHVAVFVARDLDFRTVYDYRSPPVARQ